MIEITLRAKERLQEISSLLRIYVDSGGCAGYQYIFSLISTEEMQSDDTRIDAVVIDKMSIPFLKNCTLDYVSDLSGASFVIKNPGAKSSCGCGQSFTPSML